MSDSIVLLISWASLSMFCAAFATVAVLSWKWLSNRNRLAEQRLLLEQNRVTSESQSVHELGLLLDKAIGLLSTKDPLAYQQVQAMSIPSGYDDDQYDPSDEAEILRINSRSGDMTDTEDLDAEERSFLADLGVDPFFVRPD